MTRPRTEVLICRSFHKKAYSRTDPLSKKKEQNIFKNPYLCSWSWHWQINKGFMLLLLILVNNVIHRTVANCGRQDRCLFHFLATPPGGRCWVGGVRYLWGSYRAWHEGWVLLHSPWCCVGLKYIYRIHFEIVIVEIWQDLYFVLKKYNIFKEHS